MSICPMFFWQFLSSDGTLAQFSCPGAHAENGAAKRKHRHLIDIARTLLILSFVPSHFWVKLFPQLSILSIDNRLQNCSKCPGVLFGTPPSYDHLRVIWMYMLCFACTSEHKGYRCYDSSSWCIRISCENLCWEPSFLLLALYTTLALTHRVHIILYLPSISSSDDANIPSPFIAVIPDSSISIMPPTHVTPFPHLSPSPPPLPSSPPLPLPLHSFSKPAIKHVFNRHPKDPTALPSSSSSLDSPAELQNVPCYDLWDRNTLRPKDKYGFPVWMLLLMNHPLIKKLLVFQNGNWLCQSSLLLLICSWLYNKLGSCFVAIAHDIYYI